MLLIPADAQDPTTTSARVTQGVRPESIPTEMRNNVAVDSDGKLWDTYTEVQYDDGTGAAAGPGGRRTGAAEERAVRAVLPVPADAAAADPGCGAARAGHRRVLLVILLGAVAWLVTRQVVTPVRMARRIAERLAAGRLEERMQVRGTDDLARLAISFNQMASNLQRQIRRLEELSRLQRRFVSDVSHELRTPLTTVRMAADLLHASRDDFDPVARRSVELLQNELNRFEALLADLLEITRFDAGAAALELDEVDLRDIVGRVVEGSQTRSITAVPSSPC